MKTYRSGIAAPYGLYFSAFPPDWHFVHEEGEILEGREYVEYVRLPNPLALVVIPIISILYFLLLPVAVAVYLIAFVARAAYARVSAFFSKHANLLVMRWDPTAAYLNARKEKEKKQEKDSK